MEDEQLHDDHRLAAICSLETGSSSRGSSPTLPAALQPMSLRGAFDGQFTSLWVLDTNTLLSCLDLLKALFASLLTRNVAHAAAMKQQHASSLPAATTPPQSSSFFLTSSYPSSTASRSLGIRTVRTAPLHLKPATPILALIGTPEAEARAH